MMINPLSMIDIRWRVSDSLLSCKSDRLKKLDGNRGTDPMTFIRPTLFRELIGQPHQG